MLIGILLVFFAMAITFPQICSAQYDQRIRTRTKEGPELREKYPEIVKLEGKFIDYHHKQFPMLEYEMPDVVAWVSSLEPLSGEKQDDGYIRVWSENDELKYIFVSPLKGFGQFYAVGKDSIEFVSVRDSRIDLEVTPNGIFRWQYIYDDGLQRTVKFFGSPEGEPDVSGFDIIRIYRRIVYWENSKLLKHMYVYRGEFKAITPDDKWASREDFDQEGIWIKSTLPGDENVDK
jgi:hypothetical protein